MAVVNNVIAISDLHKTYNHDIHAVQGLNLAIKKGEIYGFLGPNGAGKSTTIKMVIGLIKPTSGNITILGKNMPSDLDDLIDKIGYVPQDLIFYNHLTVRENLRFFATLYGIENQTSKIEELLELLQIQSIEKRRADQLSGGQKRRLNLAIGLLNNPSILVLDEPSAGMDPQSRNILWQSIRNIANKEEVTIILTTHLMETVDRLADRIGIIDEGKIIEEGTPEELKQKYGQGDVLEVSFHDYVTLDIEKTAKSLESKITNLSILSFPHMIKVIMPNLITNFTSIVQHIEQELGKENISSISMHENTLEDVFIHLTGRELRE